MASFVIEGGHRLKGEITPQGAKNEALEVIAATLLTAESVRITNIPNILDVNNLIRLMSDMGCLITKNAPGDSPFKQKNSISSIFVALNSYRAALNCAVLYSY